MLGVDGRRHPLKLIGKESIASPSDFALRADIPVTSIEETSALLSDVVFGAWECTDGDISSKNLPTILGRTRDKSFLALQRVFTEDDLPTFHAVLSLPRNVTNVLDAFIMAGERSALAKHNVNGLCDVIKYRNGPAAEAQRDMVEAYERK